jgi:UDP-N-acetyl-D-mannosaminuronic acid dehydrogenase
VTGFARDVVVVGGCGHVGLPLSIALAERAATVAIYDVSEAAVAAVNDGRLLFEEPNAGPALIKVVESGALVASTDPSVIATAEHVVVVIGTPVDEAFHTDRLAITRALESLTPYLRDGQLLVLRSTVYPGVTAQVERLIERLGRAVDVVFCPERIAEGKAMTELFNLPQIIAARDARGRARASALFARLTDRMVYLEPEEAELAKLFTNAWRYIKFATVNQFYMMANDRGLDFERIRRALSTDYPRAADMPGAGFTAGPCLPKDTMQLAAAYDHAFSIGQAAVAVNEGLPLYVASRLERRYPLADMTVGILGVAFKGDSDDIRSSLSYKLRRVLHGKASAVLWTDPYVSADASLVALDEVLDRADLLVIAAPHAQYRTLQTDLPVADLWGVTGNGVRI